MRRLTTFIILAIGTVIAFNPTYTFLSIIAKGHIGSDVINGIKYLPFLLLLLILVGSFCVYISRHDIASLKQSPLLVKLGFATLVWALLTTFFSSASYFQSLRGLNVDFAGLSLFLSIYLLLPTEDQANKIRYVILSSLSFLGLLAVPEIFFNHSFRLWSGHDLDAHYIVQKIPQLRSLTTGPNPFGTLLGLLAVLIVMMFKRQIYILISMLVIGVLMGLTYARSAWIGIAMVGGGMLFYTLRKERNLIVWPLALGVSILIGASIGSIRYNEGFANVLLHGKSTEEHAHSAEVSLNSTTHQSPIYTLIGHGIGTAGPVIYGTAEENKKDFPRIVESWYLQLITEVGLIGVALYGATYVVMIRELLKRRLPLYAWLAIGLGVNALTLHTWSADASLNVMFWILMGLALYSRRSNDKTHSRPID